MPLTRAILCHTTVVASLLADDGRTHGMSRWLERSVRAISVVTVGEMRSAAISARWGERRLRVLEGHLAGHVILPIDSAVADGWARLRSRCLELGRQKRDNDLWIAATAIRHGLSLATLDAGQREIPGLTVVGEDGTEITVPS